MFVVLLKFSDNKASAGEFMEGHNAWLRDGFANGSFLLAGTLQPKLGGAVIARDESREQVEALVAADPFVVHGVVVAEIMEITPSRAAPQLQFLMEPAP